MIHHDDLTREVSPLTGNILVAATVHDMGATRMPTATIIPDRAEASFARNGEVRSLTLHGKTTGSSPLRASWTFKPVSPHSGGSFSTAQDAVRDLVELLRPIAAAVS